MCINKEMHFVVKLSDEIKYNAASLLFVEVVTQSSAHFPVKIKRTNLNKWMVSVTPTQVGPYNVEVQIGKFAQKSQQFLAIREAVSMPN